jgi:hypothetical protein
MLPPGLRGASTLTVSILVLLAAPLAGCASFVTPPRVARSPAGSVHLDAPGDVGRQPPLPEGASLSGAKEPASATIYPPEVVHAARIELAREALVSDNEAKAEVEADEALQREIAHTQLDAESSGPARKSDTP